MRDVRISWDDEEGNPQTWVKPCEDEELVEIMRDIEDKGWEMDE
jgi:hypothetical protein